MPEKKIVVRRGTPRSAEFGVSSYWFNTILVPWFFLKHDCPPHDRWMVRKLKPGQSRTITLSYEDEDDARRRD
jgi:hypothetical protein